MTSRFIQDRQKKVMTHTLRFSNGLRSPSIQYESELNRSNAKLLFLAARSGDLEKMKIILRDDVIGLANICLADKNECGCGDIQGTTLTMFLDACYKSRANAIEGTKLLETWCRYINKIIY